jgi:glycosyltransferase involved in cell wall biosynthesis
MAQLVQALSARHDVAAVYLRERNELGADDELQAKLRRVEEIVIPRQVNLAARLKRRTAVLRGIPAWASFVDVPEFAVRLRDVATTWKPDVVHFEYHVMGQYAGALPDRSAARILSEYEAGVLAAREHIATGREGSALGAALQRRAWKRFERRVLRDMDAVVVFSDRDRDALEPLAGGTRIVRIGIGTPLPAEPLDPLGSTDYPRLVFIGNFQHPPNVDAAYRLTDAIFPAVRARLPNAVLRIVGASPPPELLARAGDGVDITGRVPDVTPWMNAAALIVVPLRLGGGMRVKVVEALAHGKPVIATRRAVEGLNVIDGTHLALAESNDEFVARIVELLGDPGRRATLARTAREWARANLDEQRRVAEYEALYDSLRSRPRPQ